MAGPLTFDELNFLAHHKIAANQVFDGRMMGRDEAGVQAKTLGKVLILGSECKRANHRLRTRAGHCAQCDPSKIQFERRHSESGYVYICYSVKQKLTKIGFSQAIQNRHTQLINEGYGSATDWELLFCIRSDMAGVIESKTHSRLKAFHTSLPYLRAERENQSSKETFSCSPLVALNAVLNATIALNLTPSEMEHECAENRIRQLNALHWE